MELMDFDELMKNALQDDSIPDKELNDKLKRRINEKNNNSVKVWIDKRIVATVSIAAAVVIAVTAVSDMKISDRFDIITKHDNVVTNGEVAFDKEAVDKQKESDLIDGVLSEGADEDKEAFGYQSDEKAQSREAVSGNNTNGKNENENGTDRGSNNIFEICGAAEDNKLKNNDTVLENNEICEDKADELYPYINIPLKSSESDLEVINVMANNFVEDAITGRNGTHEQIASSEIMAFSNMYRNENESAEAGSATGASVTEEAVESERNGADKENFRSGYEILTDSAEYLCVNVWVEFNDKESEKESKTFVIDKKNVNYTTLFDVFIEYSDPIGEIDRRINGMMAYKGVNIRGDEDFYINRNGEVIIDIKEKNQKVNIGKP